MKIQELLDLVMGLQQVFMANLRKHRKQLGFTQEKLAEMCNTDPCYIRQIEIGRRFPSIQYIERIAEALNIAPYRLFYDETNLENGGSSPMSTEQKQKIKAMLVNSVNEICSIIDDQY
ncbi:MAG: helix-turn-helix transcriptional regulator [Treponema sp.]|nr:helix-turn-helix transcriptional regulator [Treponema sp.]